MEIEKAVQRALESVMQNPTRENIEHHLMMMCVVGIEIQKPIACKPILQVTKTGKIVRKWPSVKAAEIAMGLHQGDISKVVNGRRNSCRGFIWKAA
jgi:hypothetical protein